MIRFHRKKAGLTLMAALILPAVVAGCRSAATYRQGADRVAGEIVQEKQMEALDRTEPFTIEPPSDTLRKRLLLGQNLPRTGPASLGSDNLEPIPHWPEEENAGQPGAAQGDEPPWLARDPMTLSLLESLQVGARNSRDYQTRKEEVFRTALDLDLERDEFRSTFAGLLEGLLGTERVGEGRVTGAEASAEGSITRRLKSGAELTGLIALDLVKLLTQDRSSSLGIFADATVSIPLLRGSGKHIVTEPLTQAERDMVYAIWEFERFKRSFAVRVASDYLNVLQTMQELENAEENYRGLIASTRRARRLADSGRLPEFEYDQSVQNELRSRNRWIVAGENYHRRLDSFKVLLGLPSDAGIELDREELQRLAEDYENILITGAVVERKETVPPADALIILREPSREEAGPLELEEDLAIGMALENRLDLMTAEGKVYDAQRKVVVAADALRAELTFLGSAAAGERRSIGSADLPNAELDLERGRASALLTLDLPLERTLERNLYRESYISLERAVRNLQELEDQVKLEVRNNLRDLMESRESVRIQVQAVELARRRVKSTDLFLQAGRAQIRDLLEAQEALLNTQNALASALVSYRVAELDLQRDIGLLEVDETGLWREYSP
jgi:outer membrane protein TolC